MEGWARRQAITHTGCALVRFVCRLPLCRFASSCCLCALPCSAQVPLCAALRAVGAPTRPVRGEGAFMCPLVDDSGATPPSRIRVCPDPDPAHTIMCESFEAGHSDHHAYVTVRAVPCSPCVLGWGREEGGGCIVWAPFHGHRTSNAPKLFAPLWCWVLRQHRGNHTPAGYHPAAGPS